ncbi:hypothetical protein CYLTODRAFT_246943 [Cylindrobasidium torrendii FP15055 ss-10]|uniref:Uncharacterized protein n=1 Tax=Cylindrobasidium torrendii FP15055 ss-10 TaxID=1314674 RepID=A0A0D7BEJ9_9AGAR|nr:hypothetical protein CYLTODRAFT_246943 [Cylindrobasidium torrendii FP15055 ss-10]
MHVSCSLLVSCAVEATPLESEPFTVNNIIPFNETSHLVHSPWAVHSEVSTSHGALMCPASFLVRIWYWFCYGEGGDGHDGKKAT